MMISIADAEPSANITFVTIGSSFSPIITAVGNPNIQWTFGDGSTSNSISPTVNFGSAKIRTNSLVVTPWSAVTKINIGYDGSDGGVAPSLNTIAALKRQNVISVSGLENVAQSLQVWASNYNQISDLDFSNFTALQTIECFSCKSLSTIKLNNVPSLTRLCIEESNISYLDLSEAPSLTDLRGASQKSPTYTINWGFIGANLWHVCVRDNPQIKSAIPFSQFPNLRQFYNWNDNQSGTLNITSTNLSDVESSNNYYTEAIFSGCFPLGREGSVNIDNNSLINLDITDDPGLYNLNASFNLLNQTSVDGILYTFDSYNTYNGNLDLKGNAAPSSSGISYANNLSSKGWKVLYSSKDNPPTVNFTYSVVFSTNLLDVQFNDTSINNPTKWIWDFGDGTFSDEKSPKHTYSSPGNYTVIHGVRNSNASDFKVVMIAILEQSILPISNFSCNVNEGFAPLNVQFTDLSENATEWKWDFGDSEVSTQQNPSYTYLAAGNYSVNLTVSNENGSNSKTDTINVLQMTNSGSSNTNGYDSSSSESSVGGSISGGGVGSPEPQNNVEAKELSQTFITSGQNAKFDFLQKVTPVVYISFDSKKTAGKTTTIVEMLKAKSTLVSQLPLGEIYKSINIWVGNSGFATSKNIENAIVFFKVEKSWVQDKKIVKSSITLNRYSDNAWNQLPTNISSEDDNFLYFTSQTPGFSPFAITGKSTAARTIQPLDDKTQNPTMSEIQNNTGNGSTTTNTAKTPRQKVSSSLSPKQSTSLYGFEFVYGIAGLLAVFLYIRKGTV